MKEKIYKYLCEHHVGKDNLITNRELRTLFEIKGDKELRDIIKDIREDTNCDEFVASLAGNNGGYWIATNIDDCKSTIDALKHRAGEMYRIAHILNKKMEIMK